MNSKYRLAAGCVAVVALTTALWLVTRQPNRDLIKSRTAQVAGLTSTSSALTKTNSPPAAAATARSSSTEEKARIWTTGLMTPINFWGRVVDDAGRAIDGATVVISAHDKLNGPGSKTTLFSGSSGMFEFIGRGLGISVSVSKAGYYQVPESSAVFGYAAGAGENSPHPNRNDPAVLVLRKAGAGEVLSKLDKNFAIPTNGSAVDIDLMTGSVGAHTENSVEVQVFMGNRMNANRHSGDRYDWRCRISVPEGGLISRHGEFDFEAPSYGYTSADEISMPLSLGPDWRSSVTRGYFLKLPSGNFARINVAIHTGGDRFVTIQSFLNPKPGSRNLEYDPAQSATAAAKH